MSDLVRDIEAILFVTGEPVAVSDLAHALNLTSGEAEDALSALSDSLTVRGSGLRLNRNGGSAHLSIRPECAKSVEALLNPVQRMPLSSAVMETLSIIAYRQPVTKSEIEAVRGVKCDYSVQSLIAKGFIREAGRRETLGRPAEYETTDEFLAHFGMANLTELPPMKEAPMEEEPI